MCTDDVIDPRAMHVYVHVRYNTTNKVNKGKKEEKRKKKKEGKLQASSADIKVLDANSNRILKPTT